MTVKTAEDMLLHELEDLYYVERKLPKILEQVAGDVQASELADRLRMHAKESETHATRLEQAFELLGEKPSAEQCPAFDGIKQEHDEFVSEESPSGVVYDLFVAGSAGPRIEHYEIAGYSSAIKLAERCGKDEVASLLQQTLTEEQQMLADSEQTASSLPLPSGDEAPSSGPLASMTVEALRSKAADAGIEGRSEMNKDELVAALSEG